MTDSSPDDVVMQQAEALIVRPGDMLIVRYPFSARISLVDAERIREKIRERIPGVSDVLVICAEQVAVYREDVPAPQQGAAQ